MDHELTYNFEVELDGGFAVACGTAIIEFNAPDFNGWLNWRVAGIFQSSPNPAAPRKYLDTRSPLLPLIAAALRQDYDQRIEEDCRNSLSEDWSGTADRMAAFRAAVL